MGTFAGTTNFASPEIAQGLLGSGAVSDRAGGADLQPPERRDSSQSTGVDWLELGNPTKYLLPRIIRLGIKWIF
jgi:hypothetical protein